MDLKKKKVPEIQQNLRIIFTVEELTFLEKCLIRWKVNELIDTYFLLIQVYKAIASNQLAQVGTGTAILASQW